MMMLLMMISLLFVFVSVAQQKQEREIANDIDAARCIRRKLCVNCLLKPRPTTTTTTTTSSKLLIPLSFEKKNGYTIYRANHLHTCTISSIFDRITNLYMYACAASECGHIFKVYILSCRVLFLLLLFIIVLLLLFLMNF